MMAVRRSGVLTRAPSRGVQQRSLHALGGRHAVKANSSVSRANALFTAPSRALSASATPAATPSPQSPSQPQQAGVAQDTQICEPRVLKGSCQCGSVGFEGRGASAINFVCHCSICRKASGAAYVSASGFKDRDVRWINEAGMDKVLPPNSKNTRYYCKGCKGYIGEDATRTLGIYALPHSAVSQMDDAFKPNHHIFYEFRDVDVADQIPKWATLPEGTLVKDPPGTKPKTVESLGFKSNGQWDPVTGWYRKDVQPLSPTRGPESQIYHFTESDPWPNHVSRITPEKVQERVARKYLSSPHAYVAPKKTKRQVVVLGGGHNGLVSAAYLAKAGKDVLVLERRHTVGGAAVTEELYPGFKFSRASYLAGLLRPQIIEDLNLTKYGFKYLPRDPSSFTPTLNSSHYKGKYLLLGSNEDANHKSISQFSAKDADNYPKYEAFLGTVRDMIQPILDAPLPSLNPLKYNMRQFGQLRKLMGLMFKHRDTVIPFYELFTAPASHILDRYFESEILKTTLATDAVIGASCSPKHAGSAYVLLHHVMGEAAGKKGVWAYVEGGMGRVSGCIADAAREHGAEIVTNATVKQILYETSNGVTKATGVKMADGSVIECEFLLSNATPYHTFLELMPGLARDSGHPEQSPLPESFQRHIRFTDYSCGAVKINCAVDKLPTFECFPSPPNGAPGPQHMGTVHFESSMEEIENAQREAAMGIPATRPVIEMTMPSALDRTIAPPGKHVVQFFVQFAPYDLDPKVGNWADERFKNKFADRVFKIVDEFCPGFSSSVLYRDMLSPLDLERIFGLHRGNIMHGALSLHQLGFARPAFGYYRHETPVKNMFLCGAGAHPGGGVMGAAGRNCAEVVLQNM